MRAERNLSRLEFWLFWRENPGATTLDSFFLSIFGSLSQQNASPLLRLSMSSTPQQGTVAARSRVRNQGDGHRAQVTQLKGCAVGITVYAGDDANNCSMFQVSVLWPVTLEMCEFEPGQGRGGAARSSKPWRRVQKAVGPAARRCMTMCPTHVSPGLSSIPLESSSRQEDGRGWHLHLVLQTQHMSAAHARAATAESRRGED